MDLESNALQADTLQRKAELLRRVSELRTIIQEREGACIYGTPEIMEQYGEETRRLNAELEELTRELEELYK